MSDTDDFTPPEISVRNKYLWQELRQLQMLHQELASLYQTKSQDAKRKLILWRVIEEKEALLFLEGIDVQ